MGYNLYITRRKDWSDEDGPSIAEDEWRSLVAEDPELEFRDDRDPLTATWSGKSRYPDPWFCYFDGQIDTKNPDPPVIAKMIEMAVKLDAKVQGDDSEVYRSPTETYFEDAGDARVPPRPWWRRLVGH